jgi:hypothetical protein
MFFFNIANREEFDQQQSSKTGTEILMRPLKSLKLAKIAWKQGKSLLFIFFSTRKKFLKNVGARTEKNADLIIGLPKQHSSHERVPLKGPKHEIFGSGFFTLIKAIWIGDLGTSTKN